MADKATFLSADELQTAIESDDSDSNFRAAASFLSEAIRDFPVFNLTEPSELVDELKREIGNRLTLPNIDTYLKTLSVAHDAWKIEAIGSLKELFDFERNNVHDNEIELEIVIEQLTVYYRAYADETKS